MITIKKSVLPKKEEINEFLRQSNAIENEHSETAFLDAWKAWGYLEVQAQKETDNPLTIILKAHQFLSKRIMPGIAGKFRDCAVYIGGKEAPPFYAIPVLLEEWVKKHWKAKSVNSIKAAHVAFEHIHPFVDGNGRTGRLVMNFQRLKAGLPLLIIHTGKEQYDYYGWFERLDI